MALVVYIGPYHDSRFPALERGLKEYARVARKLAEGLSLSGNPEPHTTLAVLELGEDAELELKETYRCGGDGDGEVNKVELTSEDIVLNNKARSRNVSVFVVLAGFDEGNREKVSAWTLELFSRVRLGVKVCVLGLSGCKKLAEDITRQASDNTMLSVTFWKSATMLGCKNGIYRTLESPSHDFMLFWLRCLSDKNEHQSPMHVIADPEHLQRVFDKTQTEFQLVPCNPAYQGSLPSDSACIVLDTRNFLLDPEDSTSVATLEEGDMAVGIPALIPPKHHYMHRVRVDDSSVNSAQHRKQHVEMSKHLEAYKRKALAAIRELFDQLQELSQINKTTTAFDDEYWRISSVYQVAKLFGWIHHLDNFFVGATNRPDSDSQNTLLQIMHSFFAWEVKDKLREQFGPCEHCAHVNYDCDLAKKRPALVACIGEMMTQDWKVPAQVIPYIQFRRRVKREEPILMRRVYKPLESRLFDADDKNQQIAQLKSLLQQHFYPL